MTAVALAALPAPIHGAAAGTVAAPTASVLSDFNGDGLADLAVGASPEDVGAVADAGAVNVLYGSASGLQATSPDDQFWTQDSSSVKDVAEEGDEFGRTLSPGDFNGDGYSDLAIGAPFEGVGAVPFAGAVNVLYGSASGLQATSPDDQFWTQDSPSVKDVAEEDDEFGFAVSAGDFNADGFADLAMSALLEDVGAVVNAGAVNVLYGSASGLQATSPDDQFWAQDSPGVKEDSEEGDDFGIRVVSGDFNGDGFLDLAVAAYLEDVGAVVDAGAVNVLYGSASGLQATSPDDQFWTQDSPDVSDASETSDLMGSRIAAGDFNGDGFFDLAVGVFLEDVGAVVDAGAVNVLYGSASGLQATSPDDQFWTQDSPSVKDVSEEGDQLGITLSAGDFNGDGFFDLGVSAFLEDVGAVLDAGAVNVLYGSSASGLQATSPDDQFWVQDSPSVKDASEEGDQFGRAMGLRAGDFNGDGFADLGMGVYSEDVGAVADAGAVNVLYGRSASGLQATSPDDQFWTQDSPSVKDASEAGDSLGSPLA